MFSTRIVRHCGCVSVQGPGSVVLCVYGGCITGHNQTLVSLNGIHPSPASHGKSMCPPAQWHKVSPEAAAGDMCGDNMALSKQKLPAVSWGPAAKPTNTRWQGLFPQAPSASLLAASSDEE